jgi:alpha-tubulin suppressor-like RCC1 family protein
MLSGGTVECWGSGGNGQLGNGEMASSMTPVPVTGLAGVKAIGAGPELQGDTTCALLADGTVSCWGLDNGGQLGNGSTMTAGTPVAVPGVRGAVAISVGSNGACALLSDSTLLCWGNVGYPAEALTPQVALQ